MQVMGPFWGVLLCSCYIVLGCYQGIAMWKLSWWTYITILLLVCSDWFPMCCFVLLRYSIGFVRCHIFAWAFLCVFGWFPNSQVSIVIFKYGSGLPILFQCGLLHLCGINPALSGRTAVLKLLSVVLNVSIVLLIRRDRAHIACHEDVFSGIIIAALNFDVNSCYHSSCWHTV